MEALINHIEEVGKMNEANQIVRESTVNVARRSQELVPFGFGKRYPVKSKKPKGYQGGTLKRSMLVGFKPLIGEVKYTAEYAGYQEFGTRFIPARKYLGTPFIKERSRFINKLKRLAK